MKLFVSPTSPYARKCRALILEKGLERNIEVIECDPRSDEADMLAANPLGKVPALIRDGAASLVNSPLICEYIDSLNDDRWIPKQGESRILVLRQQALADGLIDLTVGRRIERSRDDDKQFDFWVERWQRGIDRTLQQLNDDRSQYERSVDLGALSVAVALLYLDLRYSELDWRSQYPELAAFSARWSDRASFQQTQPPAGA